MCSTATSVSSGSSKSSKRNRHFLDALSAPSSPCIVQEGSDSSQELPPIDLTRSAKDKDTTTVQLDRSPLRLLIGRDRFSDGSDSDTDTLLDDSKPDKSSSVSAKPLVQQRRRVRCESRNPAMQAGQRYKHFGQLVTPTRETHPPRSDNKRAVHRFLEDQSMCLTAPPIHTRTAHQPLRATNIDSANEYFYVSKFTDVQVTTFLSCSEEGDLTTQTVELANSFTNSETEPPSDVINELIKVMANTASHTQAYKTYCVLKKSQQLHIPKENLAFSFEDIEHMMNEIKLNGSEPCANGAILALHYMVSMIEDELTHRVVSSDRQVWRSSINRMFSVDTHFDRIKMLIQWIGAAVNFDEFESLSSTFEKLQLAPNPHVCNTKDSASVNVPHVPKVLTVLQKLLSLALCVSRLPENDALRIATQYIQLYPQMTSLFCKKLVISSITSPYLRMKVVQRVLEDYCPSSNNGGSTGSLEDIIVCYFSHEPPSSSSFTPPPTPNEDDEPEAISTRQYSGESCEELSFLLLTIVSSYITNAKGIIQS